MMMKTGGVAAPGVWIRRALSRRLSRSWLSRRKKRQVIEKFGDIWMRRVA